MVPILWIAGPSGVGKSTVAWQLFGKLTDSGTKLAYVDTDHVALCYPESPGDRWNTKLRARNLAALMPNLRSAGVVGVVVSGVIDPPDYLKPYRHALPDAEMTVLHLHVEPHELRERILKRGWQTHLVDEVVGNAAVGEHADLVIDTTGREVAEVVVSVHECTKGWADAQAANTNVRRPEPSRCDLPITWVCGPRGVGKSTTGFEAFVRLTQTGMKAAYVDLEQVGWCWPPPADDHNNHLLKAQNLSALLPGFRDAGAERLIISGDIRNQDVIRTYRTELPGSTLTLCRLTATSDVLTKRIVLRGQGHGPPIPGDDLKGRSPADLDQLASEASHAAAELERAHVGDFVIDTSRRSTSEVAELIVQNQLPQT